MSSWAKIFAGFPFFVAAFADMILFRLTLVDVESFFTYILGTTLSTWFIMAS